MKGDIFSGRSVGPWQFCHACFSQDLCPTVPPFNGASCLLRLLSPRRDAGRRPATLHELSSDNCLGLFGSATLHTKFQRRARCSRTTPACSLHSLSLSLYLSIYLSLSLSIFRPSKRYITRRINSSSRVSVSEFYRENFDTCAYIRKNRRTPKDRKSVV